MDDKAKVLDVYYDYHRGGWAWKYKDTVSKTTYPYFWEAEHRYREHVAECEAKTLAKGTATLALVLCLCASLASAQQPYADLIEQGKLVWVNGTTSGAAAGGCPACPPEPAGSGCICCAFGTALGATTQPVNNIPDFEKHAIWSYDTLLAGTPVYFTAIVGWNTCFGDGMCDGCEGSVTVTYPDGSEHTIAHGPWPMSCESSLQPLVLSFPAWTLTNDCAQSFTQPCSYTCQGGIPCCANVALSHAEGLLVCGSGSAGTGWPVKTVQPDLDGSGVVDVQDLVICVTSWSDVPYKTASAAGDTGCDQQSTIEDLIAIIVYWGTKVP